MLKGIDLSQRFEFSCKGDKKNPTVFVLKPLSGLEMMDMAKYMEGSQLKLSGEYVIGLLGKAIVEIKNPDILESEKIAEYVISLSPISIMELTTEVGKINNVTEDERKN